MVGKFYMQRPAVLGNPFAVVKVVKVLLNNDGHTQWGAFVHPWEISTSGDNVCYYTDPWHASGLHKPSQRYDETKNRHEQADTWTYPLSTLEEFQVEITMNKHWSKPKGFKKVLHAAQGVVKRNVNKNHTANLRNFVWRWNQEEEELDAR